MTQLFIGLRLVGVPVGVVPMMLLAAFLMAILGVRTSLFVAFAIPMSMLLSFLVIQTLGMTLNMVVLFSLILALGMLVDNAIVIVENVYRHMEEGKDLVTASIDGTNEVAMAVAALIKVGFLPTRSETWPKVGAPTKTPAISENGTGTPR